MKLGSLIAQWVQYPIAWKDNLQLEAEEMLTCEIQLIRAVDNLTGQSDEDLDAWRKDRLSKFIGHPAYKAKILNADTDVLGVLWQIATFTRNWRNFEFQKEDGTWKTVTDPIEIFLHMPGGTEDESDNLFKTVLAQQKILSRMTVDELGNWLKEHDGSLLVKAAVSAPTATADPNGADIEAGQSAPANSATTPTTAALP